MDSQCRFQRGDKRKLAIEIGTIDPIANRAIGKLLEREASGVSYFKLVERLQGSFERGLGHLIVKPTFHAIEAARETFNQRLSIRHPPCNLVNPIAKIEKLTRPFILFRLKLADKTHNHFMSSAISHFNPARCNRKARQATIARCA